MARRGENADAGRSGTLLTCPVRRTAFPWTECQRVVSNGKSARHLGGGVFAQRQLDCSQVVRRAVVDETTGDVCRHCAGELALRAGERRDRSFALGRVPSAEIDLVQLAWVAAALLCFLRVLEIAEMPGRHYFAWKWLWWQLALLCVAGGLLTKWTAPAFFYLSVVPLLWRRGQLRLLLRPAHWLSVSVAALPCLAWAAAAAAQTGWGPLLNAVRGEALPRLSPAHHTRPYPWHELATFPIGFLAANLPWSAAVLWTLSPRFAQLWDERGRRLLQLLHCWTWPNLLFWSLVPGHHLRHALPLQPGLAGLAALVWIAWLDGRLRWPVPALRPAPVFLSLITLWLAVKITFVTLIMPARDGLRAASIKGQQIADLVPAERTLYLFRLKDEGILFYYGRPARRLPAPVFLPASERSAYCLLTESEFRQWMGPRPAQILLRLNDEQLHPIVLVKMP
jgi:hypothetical protein